MDKASIYRGMEEFVTVVFLSAGPVLGAAIAVAWLIGLGLGLFAVLTR